MEVGESGVGEEMQMVGSEVTSGGVEVGVSGTDPWDGKDRCPRTSSTSSS